jgi:hypothetical protein
MGTSVNGCRLFTTEDHSSGDGHWRGVLGRWHCSTGHGGTSCASFFVGLHRCNEDLFLNILNGCGCMTILVEF